MATQRIRKNQLPTTLGQMEERLLYSLSTLETNVVSANQNVQQTPAPEPFNPNAPRVTRAVSSANTGDIFGRSSFLRVRAVDDKGASNLTYHWSVESSSNGENATFANNGTNSASSTHIVFRRAGTYNVRVDIVDSDGNRTSDRLTLNVRQKFTDFQVSTPTRLVHGNTNLRIDSTEQTLQVVARDQFRQPMLDQPVVTFDFTASPEGAKPWIENQSNGQIKLRFDRAGRYQLRAAVGGQTRTVNLTVNSVPTAIRATIGGRVLSQDTINEVRTMTPEIQAVVIDQFGQELAISEFEWSTGDMPLARTAAVGDNQEPLTLNEGTASTITIKNGQLSATVVVKFVSNPAPIVFVSNASELSDAIRNAKGGEEIVLKSGVDFGGIKMFRPAQTYTSEVVIRSEDANKPAIASWIALDGVRNVKFEGIDIVTTDRFAAVTINNSTRVSISKARLTANHDPFTKPSTLIDGIRISKSENVSIIESWFHNLGTALSIGNSDKTEIIGNKFEKNLKDNINISSNVSDVEIRANLLYSQLAALYDGHHYDNIQFWVQTDANRNTNNVKILENTIFDLSGAVKAQAIFMRANYLDANGVPNPYKFSNIEIARNVIVTQHVNAITVHVVDGLNVHNNTILFPADYSNEVNRVYVPGILHSMSENVKIFHNILPQRPNYATYDSSQFFDNTTYDLRSGELANILVNPFAQKPTRDNFATIASRANRNADGSYRGAFVASTTAETLPIFTMTPKIVDGKMVYDLDASLSLAGKGIDLSKAVFAWTFADSSTATGSSIAKSFSKAGVQDVKLTITDSEGNVSVLNKERVKVLSTFAVDLDFESGMLDSESGLTRTVTTNSPKIVASGGNQSLIVGGTNGHIYLHPTDPSSVMMKQTREMSIAMSFQANLADNTSLIPLAVEHGVWGLRLDAAKNTLQLAIGTTRYSLTLPQPIVNGSWVDLAFAWKDGAFTAFVNGKSVGSIQLPTDQYNRLFEGGTYGIGIGGSGPWVNATSQVKFGVDNLQIHTVALTEEQILGIRQSSLLTR
jgi:hypothetical protein